MGAGIQPGRPERISLGVEARVTQFTPVAWFGRDLGAVRSRGDRF